MENNIKATSSSVTSVNSEENKIDSSISNSSKCIYLSAGLFLSILFDRLFLTGMPGISVTIFTIFFIAAFYIFNKEDIDYKNPVGIFALAALLISALNYTLYSNPFMQVLDFLAIPPLCTAAFILLRYKPNFWERLKFFGEILFRIIISPILNIPKPFSFLKSLVAKGNIKMDSRKRSIILGITISIFFLIIIVPLLSSADMVFKYFLQNIGDALKIDNFSELIFHCIFIFIAFIYIFGYMLSFKYSTKVIEEKNDVAIKKWINPITAITSLIPLAVVYLLFSVIQFSYLYGDSGTSLPNGFTYAEYARRGFFELVTVTAINFLIIIFITHFADIKTDFQKGFLNILLTLIAIFTFNMLFSANFKLLLYEGAYGFTYLRFFVHGFILLIFLLMIIVLSGIWINKVNILKCCLIASITFFSVLNLISPDKIIAEKNIERFNITGKIDVVYLSQLSYDAIPVLADFSLSDNKSALELKTFLVQKKTNILPGKWYEFNLAKYKADKILKTIE